MVKASIAAAALAGMLLGVTPSHAAQGDYVVGFWGDVEEAVLCANNPMNPTGMNIGAVCFDRPTNRTLVSVSIADDMVESVGFWIMQRDKDGNCIGSSPDDLPLSGCEGGSGGFCGSQNNVALLPQTVEVEVLLDGFLWGALDCGDIAGATFGTVTATFKN